MEVQYSEMSLTELKALAKNKGIKNISTLRKQELIDILSKSEVSADKVMEGSVQGVKDDKTTDAVPIKVNETGAKEQMHQVHKKSEVMTGEKELRDTSVKPEDSINKIEASKTEDAAKAVEEVKTSTTQIKRYNRNFSEDSKNNGNTESHIRRNNHFSNENNKSTGQNVYSNSYQNTNQNVNQNTIQGSGIADGDNRRNSGYNVNTVSVSEAEQLDSGETKEGILEVMPDGYGFIRCDNYLPGENDVYVSPAQIRRFGLKTGDIVVGNTRIKSQGEKFSALLYVKSVNGFHPLEAQRRKKFEDLTPVFPNERIHLETPGSNVSMRMVDLISPIGKGQRGMIVSQPKTGKTTLLKQIAKAITTNHPNINLIILLIDERPEEVTDIKESIEGKNVEVIYSTFDELPENHKRVSEMVIERAKRLVEHKKDVVILLDSITRLARAYNLTVTASGRTLSGGLDPAALHMPKRFFGAARNMREGGSLTILATALVDTGSRMDDVVFEEFKGTGNMELMLDRNLSEKRIFPAIDLTKSSTRRDDLLLTQPEIEATYLMRKAFNSMKSDDAVERIIDMFLKTKTNQEFIETIKKTKIVF